MPRQREPKRSDVVFREEGGELVPIATETAHSSWEGVDYQIEFDDRGNVLSFRASTARRDGNVLDGPAITSTLLKSVPLARMVQTTAESMRRHPSGTAFRTPERTASGRARLSDLDYAKVAKIYAEKVRSGSRRALQDVADEVDWLSYGTARNYVREARHRGLLTPTERGRQGGRLTPKATALLEADKKEKGR